MRTIQGRTVHSVTEVNNLARQALENLSFWLEAEISSFRGHDERYRYIYFDLKDPNTEFKISCVIEPEIYRSLPFPLQNGKYVLALGNLTLWEKDGRYQIYLHKLEEFGDGFLQKKLEDLIKKLRAEGLFEDSHKKALPPFPQNVCVVTSHGSDAWNDFKTHTADKFPIINLYTADIRVQGTRSVPGLLKILPILDRSGYDVIVITRGGGSLEDLAAFNDEQVTRAIYNMKTPIVVAIGHESNQSLAEWVADVRASTPTHAANIITSSYLQVAEKLNSYAWRLKSTSEHFFSINFQALDSTYYHLQEFKSHFKDLPHRINHIGETLKLHEKNLIIDARTRLDVKRQVLERESKILFEVYDSRLKNLGKSLSLLSPDRILKRGYSITTDASGNIIRSANSVVAGDIIGVKLTDGQISAKVKFSNVKENN